MKDVWCTHCTQVDCLWNIIASSPFCWQSEKSVSDTENKWPTLYNKYAAGKNFSQQSKCKTTTSQPNIPYIWLKPLLHFTEYYMDTTDSQTRIVTLFGSTIAVNQTNYIQYNMLARICHNEQRRASWNVYSVHRVESPRVGHLSWFLSIKKGY